MVRMSNGNSAEASTSPSPAPSSIGNNAPKFGTLVPNRVFVGGISGNTTEQDLLELFAKYGKVKATKVISDRAGVSKGYGFVTFETEEEARKLTQEADNIMLKDRKLNIAPAIKKQVNDLGYIKPYSPRLVDGTAAATVLGTNGTVFFGNGTTYAYTNPVPVLANPNDYHQTVTGVPTPTAAHPTFPPQVPQTGAHTAAVSAATQVGGTPGTGYPAQFMYPQTMYFPHQYQQFQTAALQPQWTASPQWRWVSPGAYAQPGPGYITSDGLYSQAAATYVPELSSLNGDSTSSSSGRKGTPMSPSLPSASSTNPFAFPYPSCFPAVTSTHHSSTMPIVHPFIHNIQPQSTHSLATTANSYSSDVMASTTSCTTVTTTTTTAVIGSSSSLIGNNCKMSAESFGNGVLEISPLLQGGTARGNVKFTVSNNSEHEPCVPALSSSSEDQKFGKVASCPFHESASSTPVQNKGKRNLKKKTKVINDTSRSSSSSSEESTNPVTSSLQQNGVASADHHQIPPKPTDDFSTPSPDGSGHTVSPHSGTNTPSPPLDNSHSKSSSGGDGAWPLVGLGFTSWCPQHNTHTVPVQSWTSGSGSGCYSRGMNGSPLRKLCGISQDLPAAAAAAGRKDAAQYGEPQKYSAYRDDALIGKPVFKVDGASASSSSSSLKSQFGLTSHHSPVMMVPWYQYSPAVNPSWFPWSPFVTNNCGILMPPPQSHCSFHPPPPPPPPPPPSVHPSFYPPSPPSATIPRSSSSSPRKGLHPSPNNAHHHHHQTCKTSYVPQQSSGLKGRAPTWILNNGAFTSTTKSSSNESCVVPFPRGGPSAAGPATPGLSYYSPAKRGSLPFLGDPVRCLQRFTQMPDDRCALLPISPPLTPQQQLDLDPHPLTL